MLAGFMTINEAAEKWGLAPRTVQMLCEHGKVKGAGKFGTVWAIPCDAKKPTADRNKKYSPDK